jgi:ZIP family zinc transporter
VRCAFPGIGPAPDHEKLNLPMHLSTSVLLVSLATFASTLTGGLFGLRLRNRLHLILGFSGGAVIGVALFHLIPESISLAGIRFGVPATTTVIAAAFLVYMVLDRTLVLHGDQSLWVGQLPRRGVLGAGSLCLHSFVDGVSIGLAFKVSDSVGALVAVAVLIHDFSDGINTVGLILKNRGSDRSAFWWLVLDAMAPIFGAASTMLFELQAPTLGLSLAGIAGFFLYIGACDLLPESYRQNPTVLTTAMTLLGALSMFVAIQLANT